jgi:hypothetical protein
MDSVATPIPLETKEKNVHKTICQKDWQNMLKMEFSNATFNFGWKTVIDYELTSIGDFLEKCDISYSSFPRCQQDAIGLVCAGGERGYVEIYNCVVEEYVCLNYGMSRNDIGRYPKFRFVPC